MLRWGMRLAPLLHRVLDNLVLQRVDTDEEMRTGESDVKKPRVAANGALTVCELAVCEDGYDQSFDVAMQNVMTMDIAVDYEKVTSRVVHADVV